MIFSLDRIIDVLSISTPCICAFFQYLDAHIDSIPDPLPISKNEFIFIFLFKILMAFMQPAVVGCAPDPNASDEFNLILFFLYLI